MLALCCSGNIRPKALGAWRHALPTFLKNKSKRWRISSLRALHQRGCIVPSKILLNAKRKYICINASENGELVGCSWHNTLPTHKDITRNWPAYVQELGGGAIYDIRQVKMNTSMFSCRVQLCLKTTWQGVPFLLTCCTGGTRAEDDDRCHPHEPTHMSVPHTPKLNLSHLCLRTPMEGYF